MIVGDCDTEADALLATRSDDERTDREIASDWLADELADGAWHMAGEVKASAKAGGIAERTLHRARVHLGVEDRREGFPAVSEWRLPVVPIPAGTTGTTVGGTTEQNCMLEPKPGDPDPQLCHVSDNGTSRPNGATATPLADRTEREYESQP